VENPSTGGWRPVRATASYEGFEVADLPDARCTCQRGEGAEAGEEERDTNAKCLHFEFSLTGD
jgi:hypothetical protein